MPIERGLKAKLRYRSDEFLSGGAGKQLLFLFVLSMIVVVVHIVLALIFAPAMPPEADGIGGKFWFFFTRILDAGTMGGDSGTGLQIISTVDTILGVVVAGLLISALAGNFQERLDAIKRGGSPVMESGHFLILGWSEKIYSVIDQLTEANLEKGNIVVVVMADREKIGMEELLQDKVVHLDRVKIVVRSGSSVSLNDLNRVAFDHAEAIIVLVDEKDVPTPNKADGRIIKTLMAIYNHPDAHGKADRFKVTAEVMISANQEIALIACDGRAQVVKTNEIISKIILQTSRISGLSLVYDELLRFEGNEVHFKRMPQCVGRKIGDLLLDFPNACVVGVAKADGSGHQLNPSADHVLAADEELLLLAEDANIAFAPYQGPLNSASITAPPPAETEKPVEHLLVLGWNEKLFPILKEFDAYVGTGSTVTLVNTLEVEARQKILDAEVGPVQQIQIRHTVGEFTSRELMAHIEPHRYPTVMVLGDATGAGDAEDSDTRAIIALLLMRDFRRRHGVLSQEVCSEILDPKNRELAATTEIHDIVISNEMVSMVIAQVTNEPRVRPVLEDFFQSDGSEIYLKDLLIYAPQGRPITFEQLILTAHKRGELALGVQVTSPDPGQRYGMVLNPKDRRAPIVPKPGDRLIVLAEDGG